MTSCKDIPESEIIEACRAFHNRGAATPDVALADRYPVKVILKKMEKMVEKGLLNYGVSLRTAWVVEKNPYFERHMMRENENTLDTFMENETTPHYRMVYAFMQLADQPTPHKPCIPPAHIRLLRAKLMFEECMETIVGMGVRVSVPSSIVAPAMGYTVGKGVCQFEDRGEEHVDIVEVLDGCCDEKVVTTGTLIAFGIRDKNPQWLVDQSNMKKFSGDGHKDPETGKWIKPSDWQPPDLMAELIRQGYQPDDDDVPVAPKLLPPVTVFYECGCQATGSQVPSRCEKHGGRIDTSIEDQDNGTAQDYNVGE